MDDEKRKKRKEDWKKRWKWRARCVYVCEEGDTEKIVGRERRRGKYECRSGVKSLGREW
jgi:hypothetical protein